MQKRINNHLNRPFPLFLLQANGRIYYFRMIVFFILLANIILALGFIIWNEYHKYLVLSVYIGLFFGLYILTHRFLKSLLPRYFNPEQWTIRKECSVFLCWIPTTAFTTCLFAGISIPEFELSPKSFAELQFYNFMLSFVSLPPFAYFIDRKFKSIPAAENSKLPETEIEPEIEPKSKSNLNLTEEEARNILHSLHNVMKTEQLYLSKKCLEQQVASHTKIPVHHISYVINTFTLYSFNDFVNVYRVEHVCRILQNGPDKKLTLEAIGYECGFRSKVSFYAAFRKFTGTTPAEYLKDCERANPSDALTKTPITQSGGAT